jgi:peptide chain release factor
MKERIIQITSGKGPEECERVVAKVVEHILKEAKAQNILAELINTIPGRMKATYLSAQILVKGATVASFCRSWEGTIKWVAQSPYRKLHRRKNWFVGITIYDVSELMKWNERDVQYQSMRASGPGGQHVNKTESAIRATHIPSGISVVASTERSQMMNKKEATERLKQKLYSWQVEQANRQVKEQWLEHHNLERGNEVRVFKDKL